MALAMIVFYKCPLHTSSGCGKREAHKNWSLVMKPEKAEPVSATALRTTGPVPANSRH